MGNGIVQEPVKAIYLLYTTSVFSVVYNSTLWWRQFEFGKIVSICRQAEQSVKLDKKLEWKIQHFLFWSKVQ